jgi:hypothetical protein
MAVSCYDRMRQKQVTGDGACSGRDIVCRDEIRARMTKRIY